jgi:hypothetical protein
MDYGQKLQSALQDGKGVWYLLDRALDLCILMAK